MENAFMIYDFHYKWYIILTRLASQSVTLDTVG